MGEICWPAEVVSAPIEGCCFTRFRYSCFVGQTQNFVWAEQINSVFSVLLSGKARQAQCTTEQYTLLVRGLGWQRNGRRAYRGWITSVILELHGRYVAFEFPVSFIWNVDIYWRCRSDSSGHSAFRCRTEERILVSEVSWLFSVKPRKTRRPPSESFKSASY